MTESLRTRVGEALRRAAGAPLRRTAGIALVTAAALLCHRNLVPIREVRAATERQLERQLAANRVLENRLASLEREAHLLRHDPWTNERILRDAYRMSRPGEVRLR